MDTFDYDAIITAEPPRTDLDKAFEIVSDKTDRELINDFLDRHDDLPPQVRELIEDILAHDLENDWSQP